VTEQKSIADITSMLMEQPEAEPVEESTVGTDEEAVIPQTDDVEDEVIEDDSDGEYEDDEEGEEDDGLDRYTVKVDGEEVEITVDEALAGYQRDSDYRKKTMALSEERKKVEAKVADLDSTLNELQSFIKREEDGTDWEALKEENPREYVERKEALDKAREAQDKAAKLRQAELAEQQQQMATQEITKLTEAMGPTWVGEQRESDIKLASEYLAKRGYSEQEIAGMVDHRAWLTIIDAAKADKFATSKQKVKKEVRKAHKSVKTGQKVSSSERKRMKAKEGLSSGNRHQQIDSLAEFLKM